MDKAKPGQVTEREKEIPAYLEKLETEMAGVEGLITNTIAKIQPILVREELKALDDTQKEVKYETILTDIGEALSGFCARIRKCKEQLSDVNKRIEV